jgi:ribosome-associated protein
MAQSERRPKKSSLPRLPRELTLAIGAALDKKVSDLVALDLRKGSAFTDFFLIGTAANLRQAQAIADAVEEALRAKGVKPALIEGYEHGHWILLDYFDFIVHIFEASAREFYALERLWGDAKRIDIPPDVTAS